MVGSTKTSSRKAGQLLLAGVLLLGISLRVLHILDSADSPFFNRPMIDGQAYDTAALAIINKTLPKTPFYQDPLYPYFLAAVYRVFGHNYLPVYCLQALLGCAVVLLVWDMARRMFDLRAGVLAALGAATYRTFIFYEAVIDKTTVSVFLTALFLWTTVRSMGIHQDQKADRKCSMASSHFGIRTAHLIWPTLSGAFLGLASLTRANLLVFAPLLVALYAFRPRTVSRIHPDILPPLRRFSFRSSLHSMLASLFGLLLVIAPVSIRNTILAREFVLTTTQAGQNFYIGNSEHNRTGQYEAPPWVRPNPLFEEKDFAGYAREQTGRNLTYSQLSRFYFRAAFQWMKSRPAAFLKLLARKIVLYFNNFEVPDNYDLGFLSRFSFVLRM
ncbi:MAG: glycosyltransferase family 39 protein, partial [candidate division WOR-3 bacterium]